MLNKNIMAKVVTKKNTGNLKNAKDILKELKGIIKAPKNYNRKKDYANYFRNKYK